MSYKVYCLSASGEIKSGLNENEIEKALRSGEELLWVDLVENTEEDGQFLERVFKFHPLTVEDCVSKDIHSPKIDDFHEYLFMIVHGINHFAESDIVETAELALFLGRNYVVSSHDIPLYSIEFVRRQIEEDSRPLKHGADFLAYIIIDALIDNIGPMIDRMMDIGEDIGEEVLRDPKESTLESILRLKRSTLKLHRLMTPQRESMNRLSRNEFPIISEEARVFFRDIYDHIVRIEDLNQNMREIMDNALAIYLSSVANRQNEVMKLISIVAAIFLPLTLIVGIYGMNFENMPELKWQWGYFAVLGIIVSAVLIVIWRFWSVGWIKWGHRPISKVSSFAVDKGKLLGHVSGIKRQRQ